MVEATEKTKAPSVAVIDVLLETDEFIAVDKPEGLASIPGSGQATSALDIVRQEQRRDLWVVHRLDKDVSGVLVFAKTSTAHRLLNAAFEARRVAKRYLGAVHGRPADPHGVIDAPLRAFGSGRMGVDPLGKPSRTQFAALDSVEAFSLLALRPESGRRHQLRAHLYSVGNPLVGDPRYGDRSLQRGCDRLMLHAQGLRLPGSGSLWHEVISPLPPSFAQGLEGLGLQVPSTLLEGLEW